MRGDQKRLDQHTSKFIKPFCFKIGDYVRSTKEEHAFFKGSFTEEVFEVRKRFRRAPQYDINLYLLKDLVGESIEGSFYEKQLQRVHLPPTIINKVLRKTKRTGTSKQYQVYLGRWLQFCQSKGIPHMAASIDHGIDFLATLFASGLGYSAINTARSALSSVLILPDNTTFGSHPLVTRLLKGVFELKPSLPRYSSIWDVGVVLTHLRGLGIASTLDLKTLTRKTTMLLCLLTGQRCQTLTKLDITFMQVLPGKIVFTIGEKLKTTRPGKHLEPIELLAYPQDESLCVVSHLKQYIKYTEQLRAEQHARLLISHCKPHEPVTNTTVGKWAKSVLREAGIDTSTFSGNSARPASTSYGARSGLTLKEILKAGGWSNAQTFAKHYHKPIVGNLEPAYLHTLNTAFLSDLCLTAL